MSLIFVLMGLISGIALVPLMLFRLHKYEFPVALFSFGCFILFCIATMIELALLKG